MDNLECLSDLDLENEVLRASDRLVALAEEMKRRGRSYAALRLVWIARQAQDLVSSETARRVCRKDDVAHPVLAILWVTSLEEVKKAKHYVASRFSDLGQGDSQGGVRG